MAAAWHDLGKADRRFLTFLYGGNSLAASLAIEPYAKSAGLREPGRAYDDAWRVSGLPDGFRHELLSLAIAQHRSLNGVSVDSVDPDLVLHLIGSHHGYCHPSAPIVTDDWTQIELANYELINSESQNGAFTDIVPHSLECGIEERFWGSYGVTAGGDSRGLSRCSSLPIIAAANASPSQPPKS